MVQPLEANYGAGATKNVPIPQTADQLEDWLSRHCDAGSQSTNLTTFRGKKKDPEGNVIREGSWYLFDQYRDSFAEHFIRIYHEPGAYLPCLNMLIPAGDGWRCKPYLDIDFPNIVVFRRLLEHLNKLPDDFYREVRHCFAKFVLDKDEEDHDSNIAFSMQPSNPHKFHLIYIGEKNLSWSKTEMKDILKKIGRFLTVYFALEDLHRVQPIMVISKSGKSGKSEKTDLSSSIRFQQFRHRRKIPKECLPNIGSQTTPMTPLYLLECFVLHSLIQT